MIGARDVNLTSLPLLVTVLLTQFMTIAKSKIKNFVNEYIKINEHYKYNDAIPSLIHISYIHRLIVMVD